MTVEKRVTAAELDAWELTYSDVNDRPVYAALRMVIAEVRALTKERDAALRSGGCRACVEDVVSPEGTARHTCNASARHVENYANLVDAISAHETRADLAEAKLAVAVETIRGECRRLAGRQNLSRGDEDAGHSMLNALARIAEMGKETL